MTGKLIVNMSGMFHAGLAVTLVNAAAFSCLAQSEEPFRLSKEQAEIMLKEVRSIGKSASDEYMSKLNAAAPLLKAASKDPDDAVDLYLDCVEIVEYDRKGRRGSEFKDWKEKNEERLKSDCTGLCLQFRARYFLLTMQASISKKLEDVQPALLDYLADVSKYRDELKKEIRRNNEPVDSCVISRRFGFDEELRVWFPWVFKPFSVDEIYEKTFLEPMRETGDPEIEDIWRHRIARKEAEADLLDEESGEKEQYESVELPRMRWKMFKDMLGTEKADKAIAGMYKLVKTGTSHPDVAVWAKELASKLEQF